MVVEPERGIRTLPGPGEKKRACTIRLSSCIACLRRQPGKNILFPFRPPNLRPETPVFSSKAAWASLLEIFTEKFIFVHNWH